MREKKKLGNKKIYVAQLCVAEDADAGVVDFETACVYVV